MSYQTQSNFTRKKLENYSYQLSNHIGKGYSSQVFKGRNDITNETVAIKVIDMKMIKGQVHKNLLASEIQVLKALKNSENIIEVYDIYTTKNNTYIITELCDGGDLSKMLSSKKTLPESEAIELMGQIINGYNCVSNRGVIHRDLKPANIFLKQNEVKIADFGFAMRNSDSKKYSSYNVGSPIYMPPEALNDNKYSFKSDVWALGVIFFQMLTGKTPWRAKTEKQLGKQLLSIPISKLLPKNLSQASNEFLLKTLAVPLNDRMTAQQLSRFTFYLDKHDNKSTRADLVSSNSISQAKNILLKSSNRDTSLNRNTINTPKNIKRFNFLKGSTDDLKSGSLPKTSTTVSMKTEYLISPTNQNFNPANTTSTQKELSGFKSANNITIIDKKTISKELLSQVHFCRFIYKLLVRIQKKLSNKINSDFHKMKQEMTGLTFNKLNEIQGLRMLTGIESKQYRATSDFTKIVQIVHQYQTKYSKDLADISRNFSSYQNLKGELTQQIVNLHQVVNASVSSAVKEQVIVLDYLITLRQLLYIMEQENLHIFHAKSKMENIVEGAPSEEITAEHISAITNKLRTLKML